MQCYTEKVLCIVILLVSEWQIKLPFDLKPRHGQNSKSEAIVRSSFFKVFIVNYCVILFLFQKQCHFLISEQYTHKCSLKSKQCRFLSTLHYVIVLLWNLPSLLTNKTFLSLKRIHSCANLEKNSVDFWSRSSADFCGKTSKEKI